MLTAAGLTKSYRGVCVVDGVSIRLGSGEVLGLLGPNGAGKTTIVGMLYGIVFPDAGSVNLAGFDLADDPRNARSVIGVVTQEDNLDPDFNAEENLIRFATYHRMSLPQARLRASELLEMTELKEHRLKSIQELSGGMKRKLVLARALISNPKVVFLDEPTTGLDPDARQDFWRIVLTLRSQGAAVLLTTHYMEEAERLCDRVMLLQKGKVLDEASPIELVKKYAGEEVLEITGVDGRKLEALRVQYDLWLRTYSISQVLGLPPSSQPGKRDEVVRAVESLNPTRLVRRSSNLEDVFLTLTGEVLQ